MMEKQQPGPYPSSSSQCTPGWSPGAVQNKRGTPLAHKALPGAVCTMEDAQQHSLPETSTGAGMGLYYLTTGTL